MIRKFLLPLLFVLCTIHGAISSTAYPKPINFTQPDGTTITIRLMGDEHSKWAITPDGYTLLSNSKGYFEYASKDDRGYLVPSGIIAKKKETRSASDQAFLSKTQKGLTYSNEQIQMLRTIRSIKSKEAMKAFPTTGNRKLICILMGFKDKAFTKTQADFDNLFNQINYTTGGATGSVKDYYLENSYNTFNLTVTVAGPYTASQNMSYYGGNDSNGDDKNPQALVTEAVTLADADVNFVDFDNDIDGNVDGVYVIYAGYGEEAGAPATTIWAHAWEIPSKTLDGKIITSYSCSSELTGISGSTITSIGVICHEFGHVLGAPDYYDTDYTTNGQFEGTGDWDLMAGGSWNNDGITPANHNAYTKVMIYGWGTATTLTSGTTVTIPASKTDATAYYRINTATSNEFYLIENRQKTGFDSYLPGHGLMIYHVSSAISSHFSSNDINSKAPQLMYPVCASSTTNPTSTSASSSYGNINSGGCPFPGTSSKFSFTDATTPWMKSWAGAVTNKPITNINENTSTGVITFDFDGGNTGNPSNFVATTNGISQIDLSWTKSESRDVVLAYSTTSTFGSLVDGTTYTVGQTIDGGGTIIYAGDASTFSHTTLNSNTTYHYKLWTKLSSTPTYSLGTIAQATTACPGIVTLPLTEDFNSGVLSGCWSIVDKQGNGQVWDVGAISGAMAGTYVFLNSDGFGDGNTQNADLVTPAINTTGISSVTITFNHYFRVYSSETATFSYSLDNGSTWVQIDKWTASTTNPASYKKVLTAVANQPSVKFKWNYTGSYGYYWCIDDVNIAETSASEVVANFNADPTTIDINSTTTFTNLSTGPVTSLSWDFGSGATPATATTAGPHSVTYSTAGKKTVTLTVNGSVTETKTDYIYVVDPSTPTVIVGWNFEDSNNTADEGIPANTSKTITTNATGTVSYASGSGGSGTYAINNTGWDSGNGTKAWQTEFSTLGYNTITVSSKQKSSNTGPKEFKLQYKTTGTTWIDVPSSNITVANDSYVSGVLTNFALPTDVANQPSVSLRWVMRSNLQVSSGNVASGGTSRIDDIVINGKKLPQYTLSVSKVGNGTVSPTVGDHIYDSGTSVSLTATPDAGWRFDKWEINGSTVTSASTQITISANTTAIATFSLIPTYTLTVSHIGNGTVTPADGESTRNEGESVTLTATPDAGWKFDKWEVNGSTVTSASTQITISANTTAVATFSALPTYTLTVSHVGNGTVTPADGESTRSEGESVTLTATPDAGWQFVKWEINSNVVTDATTQITISANSTAVATFEHITHTLNVSHVGNGTVTPTDGQSTYDEGESVTLTATPDAGWQFVKWEINSNVVTNASTQITISANTTAVATFEHITHTLNVSHVGNGTVTPTDGQSTYDEGESVTLTATPDAGWQFVKWEINSNVVTNASTQITISANTTAVATFEHITHTLNVSHVGNGTVTPTDGQSTYNEGKSVTLTATPDAGWRFDKWEINGNVVTDATTQITISANTTAVASFSSTQGVDVISSSVKVYPNPTASVVTVESTFTIKNIQVMDLSGKVLRNTENIGNSEAKTDLSGLPRGMYLLRVIGTNSSIQIIKVSKQ